MSGSGANDLKDVHAGVAHANISYNATAVRASCVLKAERPQRMPPRPIVSSVVAESLWVSRPSTMKVKMSMS